MSLDDFFGEVSRADTIPSVAAKAADLEGYRKSVEDSAAVSGGLWLSYLFVLFYLGIAAGAVTHTDLLLENPVKLPFLNIELPLLAFFSLAPVLFLITHVYTLVNLALLADRVREFHKELGDQFAADPSLHPRASKIRSFWTRQLPSNIFVQFLGGPNEIRKGAFGQILKAILSVPLVVAPIALLLLLEIQFLPYHSLRVTWINRIAFFLDLGLTWWLWLKILRRSANYSQARSWWLWLQASGPALASVYAFLFAFVIATIPGEWQENYLSPAAWNLLRHRIFDGEFDLTTRRRTRLFSNTLVLPGFDIYEALKIDDPKKVKWKQHLIDLRGRDLRGAQLDNAVLTRADLTGAQLQGARLSFAQLQGVSLEGAHLQGAMLEYALQGASLTRAQLQGALLWGAQLQGADLDSAELQGAWLELAQLQGASLSNAQLQGAWLAYAQLQGASLQGTQLQGAWLGHASLWRAQLQNSVFENIFDDSGKIDWNPIELGSRLPRPWTDATYAELRQFIEREVPQTTLPWPIPEVSQRNRALERVAILDCKRRDDGALASCDPSDAPPDAVKQWKNRIEAASSDPNTYSKAFTGILGDLLCSDKADRIYVLRELLSYPNFLERTGSERPALIKRIASPECPLSMELTDAEKRMLGATPFQARIR